MYCYAVRYCTVWAITFFNTVRYCTFWAITFYNTVRYRIMCANALCYKVRYCTCKMSAAHYVATELHGERMYICICSKYT